MKNIHRPYGAIALACAIAAGVSGCAVTPGQVDKRASEVERGLSEVRATADAMRVNSEPPFIRISGNYLGSGSIALGPGNSLPAKFSRVSFSSARSEAPFLEAVRNIREITGLAVRLNPDIYTNIAVQSQSGNGITGMAQPGFANVTLVTPVQQAQPGGGPLPNGGARGVAPQQSAFSQDGSSAPIIPAQTLVPMNFSGELEEYLNVITSAAGISWEPDEAGGIYFYRLVTRTFSVDQQQQTVDVNDITNGGGQTTLGSGGSAGSSGSGNSSSTSNSTSMTSLSSKFDPWEEFVGAVKGMLTPSGKLVANRATGTFVVTDTKASADRIGGFIASENVKLRTRVDIEIRTITFELNEGTNVGADFKAIYKALNGNYSITSNGPAVAGTDSASPGNISFTQNIGRFAGSTVSLDALDQYGKVISDKTDTIRARNRVPAVVLAVRDDTFLASTTPATGGGTSGGTGVPGLTPGLVTYGTFFTMIPSVSDNGTVIINFSSTESRLISKNRESTGQGATFQQITTPALARGKNATDLVIPKGGTEISVSSASDSLSSQSNIGLSGASASRNRARTVTITLVTPYVLPGV